MAFESGTAYPESDADDEVSTSALPEPEGGGERNKDGAETLEF